MSAVRFASLALRALVRTGGAAASRVAAVRAAPAALMPRTPTTVRTVALRPFDAAIGGWGRSTSGQQGLPRRPLLRHDRRGYAESQDSVPERSDAERERALAMPVRDAIAAVATALGKEPAYADPARVCENLLITTIGQLLDCGEKKWAALERAAGPVGSAALLAVLRLRAAVEALPQLVRKKDWPETLGKDLIGKTVRIISEERDAIRRTDWGTTLSDVEETIYSTLQLERILHKKGARHLRLQWPREIGVEHEAASFAELVHRGTYTVGDPDLQHIRDLVNFNKTEMSGTEQDVEKAVVRAKGQEAKPLPPFHCPRHIHFDVLDTDKNSNTYGEVIRYDWELDVLVADGKGGLTIGECKHSVTLTDLDDLVACAKLLGQAVQRGAVFVEGNKPYPELIEAWPKDPAKLELVMAAARGWYAPQARADPKTAQAKADRLGVKRMEHNGSQWSYV